MPDLRPFPTALELAAARPSSTRVAPPGGQVLTVMRGDQIVVWLIGEIDAAVRADLDTIVQRAPEVARRLAIEGSRVSFGDSTLVRFVAQMTTLMPVTVRRPSRLFSEILALTALSRRVELEPAPPR